MVKNIVAEFELQINSHFNQPSSPFPLPTLSDFLLSHIQQPFREVAVLASSTWGAQPPSQWNWNSAAYGWICSPSRQPGRPLAQWAQHADCCCVFSAFNKDSLLSPSPRRKHNELDWNATECLMNAHWLYSTFHNNHTSFFSGRTAHRTHLMALAHW